MRFCENETVKIDYVNHQLANKALQEFERHLTTCEICRYDVESLRLLVSGVRMIPRPAPAMQLVEHTRTRLEREVNPQSRPGRSRDALDSGSINLWRCILVTIMAAVTLITLFAVFHDHVATSLQKTVEFSVSELLWGQRTESPGAPLLVPFVTLSLILALLSIPSILENTLSRAFRSSRLNHT